MEEIPVKLLQVYREHARIHTAFKSEGWEASGLSFPFEHTYMHTYCIFCCYGSHLAPGKDGVRKSVDQEAPRYGREGQSL